MALHTKYFKAAGITVQVNSEYPITDNTFHSKFKLFAARGPGDDTITVNHFFHPIDPADTDETLIYDKDRWQIFKAADFWIYRYTPISDKGLGKPITGKFSKNHSITEIYADSLSRREYQNGQFSALTLFNTDQVLFSRILNRRDGLIIHSNGFDIHGRGVLLTGKSGVGKSTLSDMLKQNSCNILCDDRMFIKYSANNFWIHGHWNHGGVPDVSDASAPLKAIFFLEQARHNEILRIKNKKKIIIELFESVVKQFLTKDEWNSTFTILEKLIHSIDCYNIKFNLDGNICDKIKTLVRKYPVT